MENTFVTAMHSQNLDAENASATTWNGARSYATTTTIHADGALVNYLFKALRSTSEADLEKLWVDAKNESPGAANLLAFFTRDRFKGKGERKPFQSMLRYERSVNPDMVIQWLPIISYFG